MPNIERFFLAARSQFFVPNSARPAPAPETFAGERVEWVSVCPGCGHDAEWIGVLTVKETTTTIDCERCGPVTWAGD